jgi:hypothetical protein
MGVMGLPKLTWLFILFGRQTNHILCTPLQAELPLHEPGLLYIYRCSLYGGNVAM